MFGFIIGSFLGGTVGVFAMALCSASKIGDREKNI